MREIEIISLWQPWATWILWGYKVIETRTHARFRCLSGKRIGIHAARTFDPGALAIADQYLSEFRQTKSLAHDHVRGALLCTVQVSDCRWLTEHDSSDALIECKTPRFGIRLSAIEPVEPPIRMRGYQGIWKAKLSI